MSAIPSKVEEFKVENPSKFPYTQVRRFASDKMTQEQRRQAFKSPLNQPASSLKASLPDLDHFFGTNQNSSSLRLEPMILRVTNKSSVNERQQKGTAFLENYQNQNEQPSLRVNKTVSGSRRAIRHLTSREYAGRNNQLLSENPKSEDLLADSPNKR